MLKFRNQNPMTFINLVDRYIASQSSEPCSVKGIYCRLHLLLLDLICPSQSKLLHFSVCPKILGINCDQVWVLEWVKIKTKSKKNHSMDSYTWRLLIKPRLTKLQDDATLFAMEVNTVNLRIYSRRLENEILYGTGIYYCWCASHKIDL